MAPRIVLFDLGNVIVDWEPARLYRRRFGDADKAAWFCREICTLEWHTAHDRGVPMEANMAPLIARNPDLETHIRAWKSEWLDMFHGYVPGMPALVGALEEARIPLFGLSNLPAEVAGQTFDAFPMIRVLRDVVVSGAEGVVKPDPRIYEIALNRMGDPDPADVLFIDDRTDNIEAAQALGLRGHVFDGTDGLRGRLNAEGFLEN